MRFSLSVLLRAVRHAVPIAAALLFALPAAATEDEAALFPPVPMHERVLSLPGDPARPVLLQVTLFEPEGTGPFPLAVVLHGATTSGQAQRDMPRARVSFPAFYFLSRGYAVALPMMRGFAGSGGRLDPYGCDLVTAGLDAGRDIAAVIAALGQDPAIDTGRVVALGQSYGGWNALGLAAVNPPGLRGVVNVAGGVRRTDCKAQDAALLTGAAGLGGRTRLPTLWFYGDTDSLFPSPLWRAMLGRFTEAGGRAELVDIGRFMADSHLMLGHAESLPLWTPRLDAFLAGIGMPAVEVQPAYLPMPFPAPTRAAHIENVAAVPYLTEAGRQAYRIFLRRGFTRAFALAPDGTTALASGGFDPLSRALHLCAERAQGCALYAVNADVVWPARR